jgi:two-component system, LytTR family, response regulator
MTLRTLIIDDEPLARRIVREYAERFDEIIIIGECEHGGEAVEVIIREKPDLIFLDVQMPVMNGFEVLSKLDMLPAVIFSTAFDRFALKAFEVSAIDYLLKPYSRERFEIAVKKVLKGYSASPSKERLSELISEMLSFKAYPESLMVRKGSKIVPVITNEILWIEADDDYATLHTDTGDFMTSIGIGDLEKRLNPSHFTRVHRSTIVNVRHITFLESNGQGGLTVTLSNHHSLKVSRTYSAELRSRII